MPRITLFGKLVPRTGGLDTDEIGPKPDAAYAALNGWIRVAFPATVVTAGGVKRPMLPARSRARTQKRYVRPRSA